MYLNFQELNEQENSMDQFDQQLEGNPTIEWPVRKSECLEYDISSDNEDDFNRPDSGVGESVSFKRLLFVSLLKFPNSRPNI